MSRSDRTWKQIYRCSVCGKEYKQRASFAWHLMNRDRGYGCKPKAVRVYNPPARK